MARLQETEGIALTGEQALAMAEAVGFTEEPYFFRFDDLNSEAFDKKLLSIQAEAQAKAMEAKRAEEAKARAAQAQAQAAASASSAASSANATQEVVNDDRSSPASDTSSFDMF